MILALGFALCLNTNLPDCATENFITVSQEIENFYPEYCSDPFPYTCINNNFKEISELLHFPLKRCHNTDCVNSNFKKIEEEFLCR